MHSLLDRQLQRSAAAALSNVADIHAAQARALDDDDDVALQHAVNLGRHAAAQQMADEQIRVPREGVHAGAYVEVLGFGEGRYIAQRARGSLHEVKFDDFVLPLLLQTSEDRIA